jgi:p-methyltransferase
MREPNFIIISQSEVVNYDEYSKLPLDRLPLYSNLIYPRMVHYGNRFHSHLDIINKLKYNIFWNDADFPRRRELLSIWNLPGFSGINLANYLRQYDIETYVVNNFDAEWDIFCEIYESCTCKPLVGISTTFYLNYSEILRVAKRLRKTYPDISIVLGGAYINGEMEQNSLETLGKAMQKCGIDFVLHSFNSEFDLKELILARKNQKPSYESVNNLIYFSQNNCERLLKATKSVWNSPLIDNAPLFWDKLELPFLNNTIQMRVSSGCPFSCAFCSYPETAGGFYAMPLEIAEKHIQCVMRRPNVNKIIFIDDTINVPVERFKELCKIFAEYNFEWFSFLRVQFVDEDTAQIMKESGCRGVYLGIESANDNVLSNMNKKATRDRFARGIEHLKRFDITILAAFVLGFPGETEETLKDDVKFIETQGIDFYTLKEFYYMKNTPVHQKREQYGLTGSGAKWLHNTMDSTTASEYKISMFREIKNSVFVDPDTSLWYLAYLYDQGFSIGEIADFQRDINAIMIAQLDGNFDDDNPIYNRMVNKLQKEVKK